MKVKQIFVVYFNLLPQHMPGVTKENEISVMLFGVRPLFTTGTQQMRAIQVNSNYYRHHNDFITSTEGTVTIIKNNEVGRSVSHVDLFQHTVLEGTGQLKESASAECPGRDCSWVYPLVTGLHSSIEHRQYQTA